MTGRHRRPRALRLRLPFVQPSQPRVLLDHSPSTAAPAVPPAGAAQAPSAGGYSPPSVPPVGGPS